MNENDAYIFHVETPEKWTFPGGKTWVAGWFLSKTGAIFRDLRAWIDDRPIAGIFGVPRPEIEKQHRGYAGLPHAGFSFLIEPHRGAKLFRLELLDQGNNWVEIWRQPIKVRSGPSASRAPLAPAQIAPVLKALLKQQRSHPEATHGERLTFARRLALEAATESFDVLPSPPFFGALEDPALTGHTQFGKLPVTGWLIHLEQPIVRLTATTDPLMEHAMVYGQGREDAARMFPNHPDAARSQFFGMADTIENLPNPLCLRMFAELKDGSKHLVFVRRFRQLSCNEKERPYPEFDRGNFFAAVRLLREACGAAHVSPGPWRPFIAGAREAYRHYQRDAPASLAHLQRDHEPPYATWLRHNRLSPRLREILRVRSEALAGNGPTFALLADARDCTAAHLRELAQSLQAQIYPRWELRLVVPASLADTARGLAATEPRVSFHSPANEAAFVATLNAAAHETKATFLGLLPADSRLSPDALVQLAEVLAANPALELAYTDEDTMDDAGERTAPKFKPDWSPALALSGLHPGQLSVMRRERFLTLGSFREECGRLPWQDVLWRLGENLSRGAVAHVPHVGHHARASRPVTVDLADPAIEQARQALQETLDRRQSPAAAFLPETAHRRRLRYHQLHWSADVLARRNVTIVIPTRDKLHLLQECFELLNETVDWRHVRLIIVDDHSRDRDALRFLEMIQRRPELRCKVLRPADASAAFNYSHLVNLALPHIETPLVLHLNNDVNALEPGWLEEMAGWFEQADVGVVGAKLLYPEKTLNHTGIVIGPHGGLADTPYAKIHENEVAEIEWHAATREVSAVTGACLLTRTELYRQLGGFDERDFGVAYNDVDYCLRAGAAGYRVLYTPQAKLMHWGSATRGVTFDEAEHMAFLARFGQRRDPCLNPSLTLREGRLIPSRTHHAHANRAGKLRLLLLTHNLSLEGAPLFLLEYATYMAKTAGFGVEVLTSQEGPLRAAYEALGAKITMVDRHRIYSAETPAQFTERVGEVRKLVDASAVDIVVCNTLVSYWGIELARQLDKPSLFYIHESSSIFRFFEKALPLAMHRMVEDAFRSASRVLFLCKATEAYYKDLDVNGNFRLVPSWIQLGAIEEFKRSPGHSRAELRRRYGYAESDVIIANIGTVCERKGQHTFIRAVEHFNHLHHGGQGHRFLLVGGRAGIYLDLLREEIRRMAIPNIEIITETRDAYHFFALADLFACSSFEESFPRVVLEAMAFRTPIVTTDVHGIPEMVRQRAEAYLVHPGDHLAFSRMMKTCLDKERSGKSLTPTAYSRVVRHYDYSRVLPFHVELARETFLDHG